MPDHLVGVAEFQELQRRVTRIEYWTILIVGMLAPQLVQFMGVM